MNVKKSLEITFYFSPPEVAGLFCEMDANEQAEFFNAVAENCKDWDAAFAVQMCAVSRNENLTAEGKQIIKTIGEYGQ